MTTDREALARDVIERMDVARLRLDEAGILMDRAKAVLIDTIAEHNAALEALAAITDEAATLLEEAP
jgi:hypothetical protein